MKRGFEHRLLLPYRITKVKDDEVANPDAESAHTTPIETPSDEHPETGDYGPLLQLHQITPVKDAQETAYKVETQHFTRNQGCADEAQGMDHRSVDGIDVPMSARSSQDSLTWQLQPPTLPAEGLSPF